MLDNTVIARIKASPKLLNGTLLAVNHQECSKVIIVFSSSYISIWFMEPFYPYEEILNTIFFFLSYKSWESLLSTGSTYGWQFLYFFFVLVLLDKIVLLIVLIIILIIRSLRTNEQYCLFRLVREDRCISFQYFQYQTSLYMKVPVWMFGLCGMFVDSSCCSIHSAAE